MCLSVHTLPDVHTMRYTMRYAKSVGGSEVSTTQAFTRGHLTAIILGGDVAE